jgi:glycosyltransferase involved in cell wall biosynthesis
MERPLRIAIVSPLFESVPPKLYGGTERVVAYLTEELVRQGHEVTLFASGDSVTRARLVPCVEASMRLNPSCLDPLAQHMVMIDKVVEAADEFDVIHFNVDYMSLGLTRRLELPAVTTLHGRLDLPHLLEVYEHFQSVPLVSISDAQRGPLPNANWLATVHHGLPRQLHTPREQPGSYLAYLGRISPEKGPDKAIRIARRAGIPLRMAAKIDAADRTYFEEQIVPMLEGPGVEFIGEIGDAEKDRFLGEAMALLFPIEWPEPFGLVMIEAMACGTPVVAFAHGSVPEVVLDGVTGYIVNSEDDAVAALKIICDLDRATCRSVFEERFSAERMTNDYLRTYNRAMRRLSETSLA